MDQDEQRAGSGTNTRLSVAAINQDYAVYRTDGRLNIIGLRNLEGNLRHISGVFPDEGIQHHVLALSPVSTDALALSVGSQIRIYGLTNASIRTVLIGTGRTVTALKWSPNDGNLLVVGCFDGTISLWDVRSPSRPRTRSAACHGPISAIALNGNHVAATIHHDHILVWDLSMAPPRRVAKLRSNLGELRDLSWLLGLDTAILAAVSPGDLTILDAFIALKAQRRAADPSTTDAASNSDEEWFGPPDDVDYGLREICTLRTDTAGRSVTWFGRDLIITLSEDGRRVGLNSHDTIGSSYFVRRESTYTLSHAADAVALVCSDSKVYLLAVGSNGRERYDLTEDLGELQHKDVIHQGTNHQVATAHGAPSSRDEATAKHHHASMKPITLRKQICEPERISGSSQRAIRKSPEAPVDRRGATGLKRPKNAPSDSAEPPSMTSSLELPKTNVDDEDSPMPFVSPTVPVRKSPATVIAPLEESLSQLPQLPESFIASQSAYNAGDEAHDDDSDDETFVDALVGSGTFLPGGINVPLPKKCGALFAPNGQLLTFFPPKPRVAIQQQQEESNEITAIQGKTDANKVSRLFPTFGNLSAERRFPVEKSDSGSSEGPDTDCPGDQEWPDIRVEPASFPSQLSWQARISPTKPGFVAEQCSNAIEITVYELNESGLFQRTERNLAETYRLLKRENETGSGVCEHNARCAEAAGLADVSQLWRLLAMLLEDKVPLESISKDGGDVMVVARRLAAVRSMDLGTEVLDAVNGPGVLGHLRWADHPFGAAWLIRGIFDWAARRGDVGFFVYTAAVLANADHESRRSSSKAEDDFAKQLPTCSHTYIPDASAIAPQARRPSNHLPVLRASLRATASQLSSSYVSPEKQKRPSNASSRNASQPTTPYFESVSSTPPFSMPAVTRQPSRLSVSSSASPETHRSSFSAAAKYYAQSITDKFAAYNAYGTSPPLKKSATSISPRDNELSTSLPSGSWSKTVSFATSSTSSTAAQGSILSTSFEEREDDEGYDSDKTIEDNSLPHTPASIGGGVFVVQKNAEVFPDEVSGGAKQPLLPDDIAAKARYWCQYYADQLRAWGQLRKAAELEKIMGFSTQSDGYWLDSMAQTNGVAPVASQSSRPSDICVICTTKMQATEQFCPRCCHAAHLECVSVYITALGDEAYTCPAGCGCDCSDIPFAVQERPAATSPSSKPTFKKKPSFTDPKRWRARVEGDSW